MINVGIVGGTGYTGEELIEILLKHSKARVSAVFSRSATGESVAKVFPKFKNRLDLIFEKPDAKVMVAKCDCLFLALPHTASMDIAPKLLKLGKKVIDLSADYRLKDIKVFKEFYQAEHKDPANLTQAVYGLPELYRNKIKGAKLIANPGCYPTAAILALAPLVSCNGIDLNSIIIDAKSGVSGAGKKLAEGFLFSEAGEDFRAYKVGMHQHTPEIEQVLSKLAGKKIKLTFVPHLLPVKRGILETIYVSKAKGKGARGRLVDLYKKFYKKEPFVRIREANDFPRLKDVVGTNFCDIGIKDMQDKIIIIAAIDNLVKGASGQAVQNMNIMYNFPEKTGLI